MGRILVLIMAMAAGGAARADEREIVDLELVIALDASGSISEREYALATGGVAAAFRDPQVIAAIEAGPSGRIAVALMVWAEGGLPKEATPWRLIDGAESAGRFADEVAAFPRNLTGGTGIGRALFHGLEMIAQNRFQGTRAVIDLAGDGPETTFREAGVPPSQARTRAARARVTINALAIVAPDGGAALDEDSDLLLPERDGFSLGQYYAEEVIAGPNPFVMTARGFDDFARAMREKLLREIDDRPVVGWRGDAR